MAGQAHGCPVEGNRLSATIHTQPKIPLAGLDPAIYVFLGVLVISAAKTWMPGTSPGTGYLQLHRGSAEACVHGPPYRRSHRPYAVRTDHPKSGSWLGRGGNLRGGLQP